MMEVFYQEGHDLMGIDETAVSIHYSAAAPNVRSL
jgi:hypothetical protein